VNDPLTPRYMAPEQIAALVDRVRHAGSTVARRAAAARWHVEARQLTADQVLAMRRERATGTGPRALAKQYGVSPATVLRIVTGARYRDVGGPLTEARPRGAAQEVAVRDVLR